MDDGDIDKDGPSRGTGAARKVELGRFEGDKGQRT
jgi:hypothetical protein